MLYGGRRCATGGETVRRRMTLTHTPLNCRLCEVCRCLTIIAVQLVVAFRGQFFAFDLYHADGQELSSCEIRDRLRAIQAQDVSPEDPTIGLLTYVPPCNYAVTKRTAGHLTPPPSPLPLARAPALIPK